MTRKIGPSLHNAIATLLLNKKEYKDASNNYKKALEIHLELFEATSNSNLSRSKIFDDNHDDDDDKIASDSDSHDSIPVVVNDYVNIGLALFYLKDYRKAIEYYDKALKISPQSVTALDDKGYAFSNLENYDKAIELALWPSNLIPNTQMHGIIDLVIMPVQKGLMTLYLT